MNKLVGLNGPDIQVIDSFSGKYRFLSNFYPCPNHVYYNTWYYTTAEHAYQAAKCFHPIDEITIRNAHTAGQAKRLGCTIRVRPDWDSIRLQIMEEVVRSKFNRNDALFNLLLATGNALLIEGNRWGDTFWGVCNSEGENHLGLILMKVRNTLS